MILQAFISTVHTLCLLFRFWNLKYILPLFNLSINVPSEINLEEHHIASSNDFKLTFSRQPNFQKALPSLTTLRIASLVSDCWLAMKNVFSWRNTIRIRIEVFSTLANDWFFFLPENLTKGLWFLYWSSSCQSFQSLNCKCAQTKGWMLF